jgi:OPA family sugar phosphate sensor protein UhpC-like MFS transporter
MIEQGAYTAREIGYVGSAMLISYAIGKFVCGFLADRANIRRMFAFGLFVSSLATMTVGFHVPAVMLMVVWFVNGFAQGSGSPCCVVSLARWWPNRSRGTYYGIWSCSNNLGEAIAYVVTSVIMVRVGLAYGADMAWRSGFWGAATFGFVGVALISLFMRDSPQSEGLPSVAEWEGEIKGAEEKKNATDVRRGQKIALTSWAVWMVALAGGFFCMSRYAIIDWGIFFLEVKKGYATETAAWIITLNSIVGAVSSGLSGIISDPVFKGSRNELALIAGILNVTGLSLMMLVPFPCI